MRLWLQAVPNILFVKFEYISLFILSLLSHIISCMIHSCLSNTICEISDDVFPSVLQKHRRNRAVFLKNPGK